MINALCVPVGIASEEGIEAQHKTIRYVREHHTRKASRAKSNADLFNWLLQSSSPLVAQHRVRTATRKRRPLLPEAHDLILDPDDDSDSSDEDDPESSEMSEDDASDKSHQSDTRDIGK